MTCSFFACNSPLSPSRAQRARRGRAEGARNAESMFPVEDGKMDARPDTIGAQPRKTRSDRRFLGLSERARRGRCMCHFNSRKQASRQQSKQRVQPSLPTHTTTHDASMLLAMEQGPVPGRPPSRPSGCQFTRLRPQLVAPNTEPRGPSTNIFNI